MYFPSHSWNTCETIFEFVVNLRLSQAPSASLTREQKQVVDRMVEAHRQYKAQDSSPCRVSRGLQTSACSRSRFHAALMVPRVRVLSCSSGRVQKRRGAFLMSRRHNCIDCCSLPEQCQVSVTGLCDLHNM